MNTRTVWLLIRSGIWFWGVLAGQATTVWSQCAPFPPNIGLGLLRTTTTTGCLPLKVDTRSDMVGVQNVRYIYEYDGKNDTPISTASTYTYKKPGQYVMVQLSERDGMSFRACAWVFVYDTLPPKVALTGCGTRISLSLTDPLAAPFQYDYFLIRWGDGQTDTVRTNQLQKEHVFSNGDSRRIQVQGIHDYGTCGGSTYLSFTPNKSASIRSIEPVNASTVRLQIQNPSGLMLTLQQRVGTNAFQDGQVIPAGLSATVSAPADSSKTTCFRLVPTNACPGNDPSPEMCYTPPIKQPPVAGNTYYFPDAFSPNNDGLNDNFGPVDNVSLGTYRLTIFDRWGQIVFITETFTQQWDGRVDGQLAPVGAYAFQATISQANGQVRQQNGRLLLVR